VTRLAGHWDEPTISGDRPLTLNGRTFGVPETATIKIVKADKGIEIGHVKVGARVVVLCSLGQLVESDASARYRATPAPWNAIVATK
jgi:hypothetical protein